MVLVREALHSVFAILSSYSVLLIPLDTRRDNWARTVHNQIVNAEADLSGMAETGVLEWNG